MDVGSEVGAAGGDAKEGGGETLDLDWWVGRWCAEDGEGFAFAGDGGEGAR